MDKKDWLNSGFYLALVLIISFLMSSFTTNLFAQFFVAFIGSVTGALIYKKVLVPRLGLNAQTENQPHDINMNITKNDHFFFALICSLVVFLMGVLFQKMGYWSNGLFWFWVGVVLSYFIWLAGIVLLIRGFINKNSRYSFLSFVLILMTVVSLILGFLWVTFVLIMCLH